jgi:hypothetical protein
MGKEMNAPSADSSNGSPANPVVSGIEQNANRIREDTLYHCKTHFNAGDYYARWGTWTSIVVAVMTVATASSLSTSAPLIVREIVALVTAVIAAFVAYWSPGKKASRHLAHGSALAGLSKDVQLFLDIDLRDPSLGSRELRKRLESFQARQKALSEAANHDIPPRWAYEMAKRGIEGGEARYAVDSANSQRATKD